VTSVWLSCIVSEANHRLSHVEPWAATRLTTLQTCLGQPVRRVDFTDDRLALVLDSLSDDARWNAFEGALNQQTLRVYDLSRQRVCIDSTTAKGYVGVNEDGLFQCGHSKDKRPDLPQIKINLSVLDPLGMPLTTTVVSGDKADDLLYVPEIKRVQHSVGWCQGMTYIGDCKMGSLETRAYVASRHDYYLCPLAGVQMPPETLEPLLQPVFEGSQPLTNVYRPAELAEHEGELVAEGFEVPQELSACLDGQPIHWSE
jgi:transposase